LRNQSAHHMHVHDRPGGGTESRCCRFTSPDTLFKDKCMLRMIARSRSRILSLASSAAVIAVNYRRKTPFLHGDFAGRGWRGRVTPSFMRWQTAACGPRKLFSQRLIYAPRLYAPLLALLPDVSSDLKRDSHPRRR